jgi:hypothetical protein
MIFVIFPFSMIPARVVEAHGRHILGSRRAECQ